MAEQTASDVQRRRLAGRVTLASGRADHVVRWVVRAAWVALPFTAGPALADALSAASRPVQVLASVGLWAGWSAGVVAAFVALPVSLTLLRVLAPAGLALVVAAAIGRHPSALAVGWAAVTTGWIFSAPWGALCVNGPAYPNERRFLLRAPGPLLAGGLALAWTLAMAGLAAGPLLLAAKVWGGGVAATVVGLPLAGLLLKGLHNLSRRWVVIVPAGLVVHDPVSLVDPVLLRRQSITRLGPVAATAFGPRRTATAFGPRRPATAFGPRRPATAFGGSSDALDLTQRAPGLVLELELSEAVPLMLLKPGRRLGEAVKTRRLLVTPTRPGALLEEARGRRFAVG